MTSYHVLAVPWTQQTYEYSGIGVVKNSDGVYNTYQIVFTDVPGWACQTLLNQMRLISTPDPKIVCTSDTHLTTMLFRLPKLDDDLSSE